MNVCACVWVCTCECIVVEARKRARVQGSCEPPDVGAGDWTQVFCKSSKWLEEVSHCSSHLILVFWDHVLLCSLRWLSIFLLPQYWEYRPELPLPYSGLLLKTLLRPKSSKSLTHNYEKKPFKPQTGRGAHRQLSGSSSNDWLLRCDGCVGVDFISMHHDRYL